VSRLEWAGAASIALVLLITAALWVLFGLADLRYNGGTGGWHFDAGPVAWFGIGGGLPLLTTVTVLVAAYRPEALRGWQVTGTVAVLAMLAFVTILLVTRGVFEPYAWPPTERQVDRFVIHGAVVLGIVATSMGLAYLVRGSRNGVVVTWLVGGVLVALVGMSGWMSWSYPIP
jgi:hypothetical protein